MTQFLLIAAEDPYRMFSDVVFTKVESPSFLADVADKLFSTQSATVWNVAPPGEEIGCLAYKAREAIAAGVALRSTDFGMLLTHALAKGDTFALFYGSDFADLPKAREPDDLFKILGEQLAGDAGSNLELYALRPDA